MAAGKQKRRKLNKKSSKAGKILKRVLLVLLFVVLAVLLFFGVKYGRVLYRYSKEAKQLVKEGGEQMFKANQTSIIYDCNGEVITELIGERDSYYLEYKNIPYFVKEALITSEDRNFYSHSGIDFKAIIRAFVALVENDGEITQGGSTITQQLARNVFLTHQVSVERKLKEMFIAREIEKQYTKDEILEFYINNIYFGNGFYGIEAASRGYFSKSVTELSLGEIAYICAIPNNPTIYDPYLHNDATTSRKNRILKQMYEQGDIDKEMYEQALYSTIVLCPSENETNNYVETYVRFCATEALMQNAGFELQYSFSSDEEQQEYETRYEALYNEISGKLYTGGYQIYTSIDMQKQELLQQTLDKYLASYTDVNEEGIYTFQGSATCIDNNTGKVVAIVGGRSQEYNGYTLNRAYQSYRQPGSTIKPILDYTPAFERGYYPETEVVDEEIEDGPVNSPNVFEGQMTIRSAVEKSKNTIAWQLFDMIGKENCINYLKNMNFQKIVATDYVPSMSIGGMTYGVSTLEMSSAFATLENDGIFRTPTCISKITDSEQNIIIDNVEYETAKSTTIGIKQIYQTNAARMMTDTLTGVLTNGTGRKYNISEAKCAAKTGTTNGNKDVWFVGYSTYYTTAVWAGYDLPKVIDDNYGTTCPGNIWKEFMSSIHTGLEIKEFVPYVKENGTLSNGEIISEETTTEPQTDEIETYTEDWGEENQSQSGETQSDGTQSGGTQSGGTQSGEMQSGGTQSGEVQSGETQTEETETTLPYVAPYQPPKDDEMAPGGADSGLYQEYWGG